LTFVARLTSGQAFCLLFALPLPVRPNYHGPAGAFSELVPAVADFLIFVELLMFPARLIASTLPRREVFIV
jgi:hypothetical protein